VGGGGKDSYNYMQLTKVIKKTDHNYTETIKEKEMEIPQASE
jgi:hypothetical protein